MSDVLKRSIQNIHIVTYLDIKNIKNILVTIIAILIDSKKKRKRKRKGSVIECQRYFYLFKEYL